MTITLFVEPKSLQTFLNVNHVLRGLDIDNDYVFNPIDLIFSEAMISKYIWINMDMQDYFKLKYCIGKLKTN